VSATGHTAGSVAELVKGRLEGPAALPVRGLNSLADASPDQMTFIVDAANANRWASSKAGVAVVTKGVEVPGHDASSRALVVVDNADLAMIAVLELFWTGDELPAPGIHPSASIDPTASVGPGARIGAGVVIGPRCRIGADVSIHGNATLYGDVTVGDGALVHGGVVIRERSVIGARCILGAGCVIGGDGFGYRASADRSRVLRVPHLGHVVLEDEVEIGCGTTVDRGKFGATRIGAGTKIDNLCQIGHNVVIGRMCMLSGHCGIAGSTQLGDGVMMGGGAGLAPHLKIGSGARIAARAAVMNDIPAGEAWGGYPAQEMRGALREEAALRKLAASAKPLLKLIKDD
jgi:UDP-3-O-[3-hydroxymyristoyl] glucosamine N-acyltransferase